MTLGVGSQLSYHTKGVVRCDSYALSQSRATYVVVGLDSLSETTVPAIDPRQYKLTLHYRKIYLDDGSAASILP